MHLVPLLLFLLLAPAPPCEQGREEAARAEYQQRARRLRIESGERHLALGLEMRDRGLIAQAAAEIALAVEVSERQHPRAVQVLALLRRFDDRFWKRRVEPTPARLDMYEQRAQKVRQKNRSERFALAEWARRRGLAEEARGEFLGLLRERDEPLELDAQGRIVTDMGTIPTDVSEGLRQSAISINGLLYLRDAFLERLPELTEIFEHAGERLRVRCLTSVEDAAGLHALGSALLHALETELGGRPAHRLQLFVFAERGTYETYLDAAGLGAFRSVSGFADFATRTTLVCAEGMDRVDLHGLVLHELTHLAEHLVTPARMPPWYREGLAESFGGPGTFVWDGERLETGLPMARHCIEPLLAPGGRWAIAELAALDPLALWADDREAAQRFYAQSWALYQFLSRHASRDVRARFEDWRVTSRGGAASAPEVAALFDQLFGSDLAQIEAAFERWLAGK